MDYSSITIDNVRDPSATKVSPDEQSTPNSAQMSPAKASWISLHKN